jgi:hypothetical protein
VVVLKSNSECRISNRLSHNIPRKIFEALSKNKVVGVRPAPNHEEKEESVQNVELALE